jgi:hypothetical protein
LSGTVTSGVTPRPSNSVPSLARGSPMVCMNEAPSGNSRQLAASMKPGVRWPITSTRPSTCKQPAKYSLVDRLSASTSTTTGPG